MVAGGKLARILVVDDDQVAREVYGAVLRAADHDVHYAKDGDLALKFYKEHPFPVVIVDLVMPVKNGFEVIKELILMDRNVRIIAISGISPEELDRARELGAMKAFMKPIEPFKLKKAVEDVLKTRGVWDDIRKYER